MDYWILVWAFAASIGINLVFFIVAFIIKTDVFTDITYALSFMAVGLMVLIWKQNFSPLQITIFIAYNLWAIRIGTYLLIRIIKIKVDHRFDQMRSNFLKFGTFWILQGLSVFIISVPTIFCLNIKASMFSQTFNYYTLIPLVLAMTFLVIETFADSQKFMFYNKAKDTQNKFINYGLWKDSRHPNYLGEIGFWYMMATMFLLDYLMNNHSNYENWLQLFWLASPIYINCLIVFISGIPILEKKAAQQLANNPEYQTYVKKTPVLVFLIGKRGDINAVKKTKPNIR